MLRLSTHRDTRSRAVACAAPFLLVACSATPAPATPSSSAAAPEVAASTAVTLDGRQITTKTWPDATARFRGEGPWLGADSAYSVDLGAGRVLWLFGDTFIDPARDGSRTNGPNQLVRNSVAIQTPAPDTTGYDLSRSQLQFFTGAQRNGAATSFFPETSQADWYWPLSGIRLSNGLLVLFRMRVAKAATGFGFKVMGWDAVAVDTPDDSPSSWTPRVIAEEADAAWLLGASVMPHGDYLYAYAAKNADDDHSLSVARFTLASLRDAPSDALRDPEWFTTDGYRRRSAGGAPAPVLAGGQIEISVHYQAQLARFVEVQTRGLFTSDPNTAIVVRMSAAPEGPWGEPQVIWRPSAPGHTDPTKLLTYAAKAHPEQRGADLVLTYMQNDVSSPTPNDAVYYPEVLQLRFQGLPH